MPIWLIILIVVVVLCLISSSISSIIMLRRRKDSEDEDEDKIIEVLPPAAPTPTPTPVPLPTPLPPLPPLPPIVSPPIPSVPPQIDNTGTVNNGTGTPNDNDPFNNSKNTCQGPRTVTTTVTTSFKGPWKTPNDYDNTDDIAKFYMHTHPLILQQMSDRQQEDGGSFQQRPITLKLMTSNNNNM
jgi:hypothetical protein